MLAGEGRQQQGKRSGNNPNCVGENVSPQLSWVNPPAGTKSFALLMVDPEGRGGAGVNHWVAYGIPADVTGFAEGEVSKDGPTSTSAARAPRASASIPARARRRRAAAPLHVRADRDRS